MNDFLLELRCEEIPARMQAGARADLEKLFRAQMSAAGVAVGELTVWSTPRRLALIAHDLPLATEGVSEETKGPRTSAPPQALEGFLRKTGLSQDQLQDRDGVYFAVVEKPGRAVKDVLAEAIPAIIRAFPWPKSMRWGAASVSTESARWVRPLSGVVAILGEDLVECEAGGVASGYATRGHRFHCPGEITIGSAADYQDKLRACHVIVDHVERQGVVREMSRAAALAEGLTLVEDEGLVIENAGLTEWPVPLLGRFDESFLDVPPEVIQLTARVNQKYFVCEYPPQNGEGDHVKHGGGASPTPARSDKPLHHPAGGPPPRIREDRKLANAFVCTANIVADDPAVVVDGNRKVLAARLSDARFFWEQDRKTPLAVQAEKLSRITFHEKLGTVADKVERVAKLARWLVEEGIVKPSPLQGRGLGVGAAEAAPTDSPHSPTLFPEEEREKLADLAEQAARLCKADLVTDMVGEFPELQGLMGGYYARAEGLPDAVADAIRDHYKPVGQGDDVPTAPVTVAVSLADKLDTLVGFFEADLLPTGSKDPYALRRAALGIIAVCLNNGLRLNLLKALSAWFNFRHKATVARANASASSILDEFDPDVWKVATLATLNAKLLDFFADRLKVQQREAGVRHDLIDAVFALGGEDDLVRLLARVTALQSYVETAEGANLLAGYKRAANILKKEGVGQEPSPLQGRGLGVGAADAAPADSPHPPTPSPEGEWEEGAIPQTGEEDPLSLVDDPGMKAVVEAKMAMRTPETLSYTPEPAEQALIDALDAAEPLAEAAIAAEDFAGAMSALASLRAPIDAFFEAVTVNDADPAKRSARLALLARFRAAVHNVADFSRIEG